MASTETRRVEYDFYNPGSLAADWDTSVVGTGAVAIATGVATIATTTTDDSAVLALDTSAAAGIPIAQLKAIEFYAKLSSAAPDIGVHVAMGVCSAPAAASSNPEASAVRAIFRKDATVATGALYVNTDDATTDTDVAAGETLSTTYKRFRIDFRGGLKTVSPPSSSEGGKSSVLFSVGDNENYVKRIVTSSHMDMSEATAQLQPYFAVRSDNVDKALTLSVKGVVLEYEV